MNNLVFLHRLNVLNEIKFKLSHFYNVRVDFNDEI